MTTKAPKTVHAVHPPEPAPAPPAAQPGAPIEPVQQQQGVWWGVYSGGVDESYCERFAKNFAAMTMTAGVTHVHLLMQCLGGFVGSGVFLHNLIRTAPFPMTIYNGGQIASAGVTAYLGAGHRVASRYSAFMLHRAGIAPMFSNATKLSRTVGMLNIDDERSLAIVRDRSNLPNEVWAEMEYHDVHLSAAEAVKYGIAHEIGEFTPPLGTKLFDFLYAG
jgi:ATP-dependent Clp protease, protease subunit